MKNQQNWLLLVIGFFLFWVNGDNYAAATLVLGMSEEFGTSVPTAAFSVVSYMLGFGVFTLFFGPLGDRFGKTRILKIAALGSAIGSITSTFMPTLGAVIALRAVNGAFSAGIMPISVAYIGENSSQENRHARIARVMGLMFLGGAMATVIGGTLSLWGSWRLVYLMYGISEFLLLIPLFILLPRTEVSDKKSLPGLPYGKLLRETGFLQTIGILFFLGMSTLGTFSYLGGFLRIGRETNLIVIGLVLASYGVGTLIGGRAGVRLKQKMGRRFLLLSGFLGTLGFSAFRYAGFSLWLAVPGLFLAGFAFIGLQSTIVTAAQDLAPMKRGAVMSLASFTMITSAAIGTFLNGRIFQIRPDIMVWGAAGMFLLSGLMASAVLSMKPMVQPEMTAKGA